VVCKAIVADSGGARVSGARTHSSGSRPEEDAVPLVNVKLVEGVFTEEQKHAIAADLTEVMVKHEGSEAFRDVVWVLIEELHPDGWHIGGEPFRGPRSLIDVLAQAKTTFESIEGSPRTREEFAAVAPPRANLT
jgi:4-oxalocrotonate tautomerase